MRLITRAVLPITMFVSACGLVACGGGGGDSLPSPATPPATPPSAPTPSTPNFAVASSSVSFNAATTDPVPATEAINIEATNAGATVFFSVSAPRNILSDVSINSTGPNTGNLQVVPKPPAALGAGVHAETITANACYDQACTQLLPGSPQTISVSYSIAVANPNNRNLCSDSSVANGDGTANRINSASCGQYNMITSRQTANGMGGDQAVTLDYMIHQPPTAAIPKGIVVLFAGGGMDTGITGNIANGTVATAGPDFLIRSAQLFADNGFITLAINRPSDRPTANVADPVEDLDQYRLSVDQAVDVAQVLTTLGVNNRKVFFVGYDRGALSVFSMNNMAAGVAVASPVTSEDGNFPNRLYLNRLGYPRLQPAFVDRPIQLLKHVADGCAISSPMDTDALAGVLALSLGNQQVESNGVTGGFNDSSVVDTCAALQYHGFLGIEKNAINLTLSWLNDQAVSGGMNIRPAAQSVSATTVINTPVQISLAGKANDPNNNDVITYSLPFAATTRGGSVTINGTSVSYIPPANQTNITDAFVYVADDGNGGVATAVVSVAINANANNPPVASPLNTSTETNTTLQVDLSTLVNDADGDNLVYSLPQAATALGGTVVLEGDRVFNQLKIVRYEPPQNTAGVTDSFTFAVADGKGGTDNATISVSVNAKVSGQLDLELYQKLADPVLSAACTDCHEVPNGSGSYDIYYLPLFSSQQMKTNFSEAAKHANINNPAGSRLLQKAIGQGHGGGAILNVNGQGYQDILTWIQTPVP